MRDNENIANRIKKAKRELAELKTAQPIGGDSWIMYRYTYDMPNASGIIHIEFLPDVPGIFPVVMTLQNSINDPPSWQVRLLPEDVGVYEYWLNRDRVYYTQFYLVVQTIRTGTIKVTML